MGKEHETIFWEEKFERLLANSHSGGESSQQTKESIC